MTTVYVPDRDLTLNFPDGTDPEQIREAIRKHLYQESSPGFLDSALAGARESLGDTFEALHGAAERVGGLTGLEPGGFFQKAARALRPDPDLLESARETLGGKAGLIAGRVAGMLPEFLAAGRATAPLRFIPWAGRIAQPAGQFGLVEALREGPEGIAKGAAAGGIFGLANLPASRAARALLSAGAGAGIAASGGADLEETLVQGALMGTLSALAPERGTLPPRPDARSVSARAETLEDVVKEVRFQNFLNKQVRRGMLKASRLQRERLARILHDFPVGQKLSTSLGEQVKFLPPRGTSPQAYVHRFLVRPGEAGGPPVPLSKADLSLVKKIPLTVKRPGERILGEVDGQQRIYYLRDFRGTALSPPRTVVVATDRSGNFRGWTLVSPISGMRRWLQQHEQRLVQQRGLVNRDGDPLKISYLDYLRQRNSQPFYLGEEPPPLKTTAGSVPEVIRTPRQAKEDLDLIRQALGRAASAVEENTAPAAVRAVGGRLDTGGVRTLGLAIRRDLIQKGRVDLRGRPVRSAEDLAALAQVYRDPRFETFRVFYIKDNRIVAHEGVTSRMPHTTTPFLEDRGREIFRFRRRMQRLGADGYYLLHNHTAGDPRPSANDVALTRFLGRTVPGLRGHVVINSGKFAVIDAQGRPGPLGRPMLRDLPEEFRQERLLTPEIAHAQLTRRIERPEDLLGMAESLRTPENFVVLAYRDTAAKIRAIQEVPLNLFKNRGQAEGFIRARARDFGGFEVFSFYKGPQQDAYLESARGLLDRGILRDAVTPLGGQRSPVLMPFPLSPDLTRWMGRRIHEGLRASEALGGLAGQGVFPEAASGAP